ncbi:MAG: hypothetical protein U1F25_02290 [Rubrivivax sp.]
MAAAMPRCWTKRRASLLDATRSPLWHPSLAISIPEAATDATRCATPRGWPPRPAALQIHVNEHLASVERSLSRARPAAAGSTCTRPARSACTLCSRTARC